MKCRGLVEAGDSAYTLSSAPKPLHSPVTSGSLFTANLSLILEKSSHNLFCLSHHTVNFPGGQPCMKLFDSGLLLKGSHLFENA